MEHLWELLKSPYSLPSPDKSARALASLPLASFPNTRGVALFPPTERVFPPRQLPGQGVETRLGPQHVGFLSSWKHGRASEREKPRGVGLVSYRASCGDYDDLGLPTHLLSKWSLSICKHVVCMCLQAGVSAWDLLIKHILNSLLKKTGNCH